MNIFQDFSLQYMQEVMSPRCQHRSVLTLLPAIPTNKNSWTRHQWENPRTRDGRLKYILHHKDQDSLPLSQYIITQRGLPWAFSDIQTPEYCGSLPGNAYLGFTPQGLQGNLQDSTTGNLIVTEKGGGASNNQHADLSRLHWYLQSLSSSPNEQLCASAEPSWWHKVVQACLIWVLQTVFQSWNLVCPCPG